MNTKTDIIIAILKQTNNGHATRESIVKAVNMPLQLVSNILREIHEKEFIEYNNEHIEQTSNQRIKLAIHAINNGTDIERICKVLEWKEFEKFSATAFEKNNFAVKRNFRFKAAQRRWEIDILAYCEPIILCVDCKRWRRGWGNSAISKIAEAQSLRTKLLANNIQFLQRKIELNNWERANLFPVILSLFPGSIKIYKKVPVVPILQLQSFIDEFQGHQSELANFKSTIGNDLSDYLDINS